MGPYGFVIFIPEDIEIYRKRDMNKHKKYCLKYCENCVMQHSFDTCQKLSPATC